MGERREKESAFIDLRLSKLVLVRKSLVKEKARQLIGSYKSLKYVDDQMLNLIETSGTTPYV